MRAYVRMAAMHLVNASPPKPLDVATAILQVHRSHNVDISEKHFVPGQMMYFLVNAFPLNPWT